MPDDKGLIRILLIEDNVDDIMITQKALLEAKIVNQLDVVRDGQEALEYLLHQGRYQDPSMSPQPGLILLDINMPKMNGLDVLNFVKQHPDLKTIPIVMLTSSTRDQDLVEGYDRGCNSFLQKPVEFDRFVELIKQVGLYWGFMNVNAPPR